MDSEERQQAHLIIIAEILQQASGAIYDGYSAIVLFDPNVDVLNDIRSVDLLHTLHLEVRLGTPRRAQVGRNNQNDYSYRSLRNHCQLVSGCQLYQNCTFMKRCGRVIRTVYMVMSPRLVKWTDTQVFSIAWKHGLIDHVRVKQAHDIKARSQLFAHQLQPRLLLISISG